MAEEAVARKITCSWHECSSVPAMVQEELVHELGYVGDVLEAMA